MRRVAEKTFSNARDMSLVLRLGFASSGSSWGSYGWDRAHSRDETGMRRILNPRADGNALSSTCSGY